MVQLGILGPSNAKFCLGLNHFQCKILQNRLICCLLARQWNPQPYMPRRLNLHLSFNQVYYTACSLLVTLKNSLGKIHRQKGSNLISLSYQILYQVGDSIVTSLKKRNLSLRHFPESPNRNPQTDTRNSGHDLRSPKPETRNPKPETRHYIAETRNCKPQARKLQAQMRLNPDA